MKTDKLCWFFFSVAVHERLGNRRGGWGGSRGGQDQDSPRGQEHDHRDSEQDRGRGRERDQDWDVGHHDQDTGQHRESGRRERDYKSSRLDRLPPRLQRHRQSSQGSDEFRQVEEQNDRLVVKIENDDFARSPTSPTSHNADRRQFRSKDDMSKSKSSRGRHEAGSGRIRSHQGRVGTGRTAPPSRGEGGGRDQRRGGRGGRKPRPVSGPPFIPDSDVQQWVDSVQEDNLMPGPGMVVQITTQSDIPEEPEQTQTALQQPKTQPSRFSASPEKDAWQDAVADPHFYDVEEPPKSGTVPQDAEGVEGDIHNSSAESLDRFIQEHTLKLNVEATGLSNTSTTSNESQNALSPDFLLKTPVDHVKVLDWGAAMDAMAGEDSDLLNDTDTANHELSFNSAMSESPKQEDKSTTEESSDRNQMNSDSINEGVETAQLAAEPKSTAKESNTRDILENTTNREVNSTVELSKSRKINEPSEEEEKPTIDSDKGSAPPAGEEAQPASAAAPDAGGKESETVHKPAGGREDEVEDVFEDAVASHPEGGSVQTEDVSATPEAAGEAIASDNATSATGNAATTAVQEGETTSMTVDNGVKSSEDGDATSTKDKEPSSLEKEGDAPKTSAGEREEDGDAASTKDKEPSTLEKEGDAPKTSAGEREEDGDAASTKDKEPSTLDKEGNAPKTSAGEREEDGDAASTKDKEPSTLEKEGNAPKTSAGEREEDGDAASTKDKEPSTLEKESNAPKTSAGEREEDGDAASTKDKEPSTLEKEGDAPETAAGEREEDGDAASTKGKEPSSLEKEGDAPETAAGEREEDGDAASTKGKEPSSLEKEGDAPKTSAGDPEEGGEVTSKAGDKEAILSEAVGDPTTSAVDNEAKPSSEVEASVAKDAELSADGDSMTAAGGQTTQGVSCQSIADATFFGDKKTTSEADVGMDAGTSPSDTRETAASEAVVDIESAITVAEGKGTTISEKESTLGDGDAVALPVDTKDSQPSKAEADSTPTSDVGGATNGVGEGGQRDCDSDSSPADTFPQGLKQEKVENSKSAEVQPAKTATEAETEAPNSGGSGAKPEIKCDPSSGGTANGKGTDV